jgi:TolA-binding protein
LNQQLLRTHTLLLFCFLIAACSLQVEQLSVRLETLEMQLSSSTDAPQHQQQLQQQQETLLQLHQQRKQQQAVAADLEQQLQQLQGRIQELDQQLQQQQKQQHALLLQQQRAEAKAADAAAGLKRSKQELKQLVKDFGCHDAVNDLAAGAAEAVREASPDGAAAAAAAAGAVPTAKEMQQMLRQAKRLQQEAAQLEVPELPAAQKVSDPARAVLAVHVCEEHSAFACATSAHTLCCCRSGLVRAAASCVPWL